MRMGQAILRSLFLAVLCVLPLWLHAVTPAELRTEQERIEDLRIVHRAAVQDLHDARALAYYLRGWGGPDREAEVEDAIAESEYVFNLLRGIDHGGMALQATMDVTKAIPAAHFALLQRARGKVAGEVNAYYRRSHALKGQLTETVLAAAKAKTAWTVDSTPAPWADPAREAGRRDGLRYGWALDEAFFKLPEAEQEYLLAKGRKMGISYVNISWRPLCDWAELEKTAGTYDFQQAQTVLERVKRHGMRAALMLNTLTGTPPAWHIEQQGTACRFTRTVLVQGKPAQEGVGINRFHPPTATAHNRFLQAYAAYLRLHEVGVVEGLYLEGGQREIEAVADESPAMEAYWRAWSKTNTPWRTPEALRAQQPVDDAAVVRAEQCREAWLLDYLQGLQTTLRTAWPGVRLQLPNFSDDFHRMHAADVGLSRNAFALAQLADNPGSATDSPASFTVLHSGAAGKWLWQTGIHSGCGTTASAASAQPPFYDANRVTIGATWSSVRAYFPGAWNRYPDFQLGDTGIGSYYLSPRKSQEYAPVIMNTALPAPQVAVLWSQSTLRRDPEREHWRSVMAMGHLLRRSFVTFDYLPEAGLAERLTAYKVLILSDTQTLPTATCEAIRAWVQGGGTVLAFGAPGIFDEHGTRRAALPLADVFGATISGLRVPAPVTPDKLYTGHPEGAFVSPAPHPWQYKANLTAVLQATTGKARAWYASAGQEAAIVEHSFGAGKALLCGYPLGFLYRESAPYEFAYGLSHSRTLSYNAEGKVYEAWMVAELEKLGVTRPVTVPYGRFLRAQSRDDGDWTHTTTNGPKFREYNLEEDRPARTVAAVARTREGIDNVYVGLLNTEGNYFWERGYFRSTLGGGQITVSVAVPAVEGDKTFPPVAYDVRLGVPVPLTLRNGRGEFTTWLPAAQSSLIAVAPAGKVRLFGEATPHSESPAVVAQRTATYEENATLAAVEVLDRPGIEDFLAARRDKTVTIGYGDVHFRPAAEMLAAWLKREYNIAATLTAAGRRTVIRQCYMDGFGYNQVLGEPTKADIVIGNSQQNGLMFRYALLSGDNAWLPLEANDDFPGLGHAFVTLSLPLVTQSNGRPGGRAADAQLVFAASFPAEAQQAVREFTNGK